MNKISCFQITADRFLEPCCSEAIQEQYKDVFRSCRKKIGKAKDWLGLHLLPAVKDNKSGFINTSSVEKGNKAGGEFGAQVP